jgi:hypothetical protein
MLSRSVVQLLSREAFRFGVLSAFALFACAVLAAFVRLFPWLLEPNLPWRVTWPFARSLLVLAAEAAVVLGWPLGWALAAARLVDRGEARVLATLGESPWSTTLRLRVQGLAFALVLGALSLLGGRDANAPGLVVQELLDEGKTACALASTREAHVVPLVKASWLCSPGLPPRLVGKPPGLASALTFTAGGVHVSPDLARFELDDARLLTPPVKDGMAVALHVRTLVLRGLPPFAFTSSLPAWLRALVLALAAWGSAKVAVAAILAFGPTRRLTVRAASLGVAGPLLALFVLRQIEARAPSLWAYGLVPVLAFTASVLLGWMLSRLPAGAHTGTK